MLVSQIIETGFPILSLSDKAGFALQLMEDYDLQHLPIITEDKFAGLISKEDLSDVSEHVSVATLQSSFIKASVLPEEHLLSALKLATHFDI